MLVPAVSTKERTKDFGVRRKVEHVNYVIAVESFLSSVSAPWSRAEPTYLLLIYL